MSEERPSRTADRVALQRAAHQLFDRPLLFDDPLAVRLLDADGRAALERQRSRLRHDPFQIRTRAIVVVRSRIAEERLAEAVDAGVRQYVSLGTGLETFAYRNPWPELRVFEVDLPAARETRLRLFGAAGIEPPTPPVGVALDLERDVLVEALVGAGLDLARPVFVSCLGVLPYLTRDTARSTLRALEPLTRAGGGVVFTYTERPARLALLRRLALALSTRRARRGGERHATLFAPQEIERLLAERGFAPIEDLDSRDLNRRYFAGRSDGLRVGHLARVVTALRRDAAEATAP